MAEHTQQKSTSRTGAATLEFDDFELRSTMQEFLKEDEKDTGKSIWNIATISGMAMLFLGLTFVLQTIGLPIGEGFSSFVSGIISAMPLIGGALVTLIGFGYLVGDRKKASKIKRRSRHKETTNDIHGAEDFDSFSFNERPVSETTFTGGKKRSKLSNDLDSEFDEDRFYSRSGGFEQYGYRAGRKLMRSRTDKKWAGVCGGLAKYFGISSTVVRFIFVAAFFMGYGASLLIYFGLSLAMPKEPVDSLDDFDYYY